MEDHVIPQEIKQAAVGMLAGFIPDLTPDTLEARLLAPVSTAEEQVTDRLRSRKGAAAALSISLPTLDRAISAGEIIPVKVRGRVFVRQSDIDRIIRGEGSAK